MFLFTLQSEKEKKNPLSSTQLQPSCVPPERNPFKVHGPKDKDPEKKRVQTAEGDEKRKDRDSQPSPKADGGEESYQKENVKQEAAGVAKERESKIVSSDMHRGKHLPVGMKVKKRVSDEERPKDSNWEKETDKVKDKRESDSRPVHPEKINPTSQDPHRDKHKNQADGKTCMEPTDPSIKKTLAKSLPDSGTEAIKNSESTRKQTSESSTRSTDSSHTKNHQADDDDDDVLLVSVKPATKKSPPASAVQKTLTAFSGFQPASKVKGQQEDPRGLRNMLTTQLQQKKVSVEIHDKMS